jgi:hypothetical protein
VAAGNNEAAVWGLPEAAIENVTLKDVNITADKPFGIFFAKNVQLTNCNIKTKEGKNKLSVTNTTITIDGEALK